MILIECMLTNHMFILKYHDIWVLILSVVIMLSVGYSRIYLKRHHVVDVVAGFLMKRKNVELFAIHFSHEPFTDKKAEEKARKLAVLLGVKKFFVGRAGEVFAELARNAKHSLYFVLSKRMMYKVAEKIAEREHCTFLVTGENLGQVSSQILSNLKKQ